MLGVRVGRGCIIDTTNICEPDLISIGHNCTVADDALVTGAMVAPPGFLYETGKDNRAHITECFLTIAGRKSVFSLCGYVAEQ